MPELQRRDLLSEPAPTSRRPEASWQHVLQPRPESQQGKKNVIVSGDFNTMADTTPWHTMEIQPLETVNDCFKRQPDEDFQATLIQHGGCQAVAIQMYLKAFLSPHIMFLIALQCCHLWVPQNIKLESNGVTEHKLIINDMLAKPDHSTDLKERRKKEKRVDWRDK